MAKSEQGRHWHISPEDFKFRHCLLSGKSFAVANSTIHINPSVLFRLRGDPPAVLLFAGAWIHPTNILAVLWSALLRKSKRIFWSESHLKSIRIGNQYIDKLRGILLRSYDGFAIPGKLAKEYVQYYAPGKPSYDLPNVVDETVFKAALPKSRLHRTAIREKLGSSEEDRVLVLPARLIPEKGILEFLAAADTLAPEISRRLKILIAGEGPLKGDISSWAANHSGLDVRMLGFVDEARMVELYAAADVFILPSFSDPNPLSVIEALWAGLPLALSSRVGNHFETLAPGQNGWLFEPDSVQSTRDLLEKCVGLPLDVLKAFGRESSRIADRRFTSANVVNDLLDQVLN